MKRLSIMISAYICFLSCTNTPKKIFTELENFDNSLDSLITEETFSSTPYLIFQGDTLKNNPKQIKVTCYQKNDNDSILIGANSHIYKFANNELIINQQEDNFGNKYVYKIIYFKDKIDNKFISDFKIKYANTDTFVNAFVKKYNKKGQLIKLVYSDDWIEVNLRNRVKTKEIRRLEVYSYDQVNNTCTKWRRNYFNSKYNVDSIKQTPIKKIKLDRNKEFNEDSDYSYTYDKYGNWIIKKRVMGFEYEEETNSYIRRKPKNYDVYYRKITY